MQGWRSDAAQYLADRRNEGSLIPFYFEAINYCSTNNNWQTLELQLGHFKQEHIGP